LGVSEEWSWIQHLPVGIQHLSVASVLKKYPCFPYGRLDCLEHSHQPQISRHPIDTEEFDEAQLIPRSVEKLILNNFVHAKRSEEESLEILQALPQNLLLLKGLHNHPPAYLTPAIV
jgi:hypothetical protein